MDGHRPLEKAPPAVSSATISADLPDHWFRDGAWPRMSSRERQERCPQWFERQKHIRRKVDVRLCTLAGLLCSLNLLDSGILASAAVTSMPADLGLDQGSRFSVAIFSFTIASVICQLPCTLAVRYCGPRRWFAFTTVVFGLMNMLTAFAQQWWHVIILRVVQGMAIAGMYPGLTYLISTWYLRREQQLRFAILQAVEVVLLALGNVLNWRLAGLDGVRGYSGWRWMYLVQGPITIALGIITYWWMIDFPETTQPSQWFLNENDRNIAVARVNDERADAFVEPLNWARATECFKDLKLYGFACLYFLLNLVSTAVSYFLPTILEDGLGVVGQKAILLSVPPYLWAAIAVLATSLCADSLNSRGPFICLNALCIIFGFVMLYGAPAIPVGARYAGMVIATGGYVSNWAALNAYQANNVIGQWKRAITAATVAMFEGMGSVAGSFVVRQVEAPKYPTAFGVALGSQLTIVMLVVLFSIYFRRMNNLAEGGRHIMNVPEFRYTT
ncbi:Uncharacterized protein PECH_006733 [Penicillium ucsense]|uniref:Major facilitator superfamily (MFS) profile domain-containing protein n=1 Tax=Penicillium ucsense TaxID=2839758 RepID=A0A8J8W0P9_9EURO|nr:Uncharacterized protein PECM_000436 [Penicillium ucsense]KAF7735322.1 Uncharacterized protein PECH_006733 [Penicillium ucsense]